MKGVLFDFWGTLVENAIRPSPIRQVQFYMNLEMPFSDYVVRFEEVFDVGAGVVLAKLALVHSLEEQVVDRPVVGLFGKADHDLVEAGLG